MFGFVMMGCGVMGLMGFMMKSEVFIMNILSLKVMRVRIFGLILLMWVLRMVRLFWVGCFVMLIS